MDSHYLIVSERNFLASVIPSSKRKIQFKNIQLNSRERTRLANKRKPPSKPIATIEAVPLDLVEIKISPNKRKIPDVNNDLGKNQLEQSKGNIPDTILIS